jgi:hypothetical protein
VNDAWLAPADRLALQERLAALGGGAGGTRRAREENHVARDLPARLRQQVEEQLAPGEQLLWADRPGVREYLLIAPLDTGTAALGLLAGLVSILTLPLVSLTGMNSALSMGIGFAAGLWMVTAFRVGRLIRGTVYAVTDRGGFVLAPWGETRRYTVAEMRRFQRTESATGRGTLAASVAGAAPGFYGVRDVKTVDDLVKGRPTRDHSTELTPAEALPGRGDEVAPGE